MEIKNKPKTIISWSSGKDSAFALHQVRIENKLSVVGLLTTLNGENERVSIHGVRKELLEKQLGALGLPAEMVMLPMAFPSTITWLPVSELGLSNIGFILTSGSILAA